MGKGLNELNLCSSYFVYLKITTSYMLKIKVMANKDEQTSAYIDFWKKSFDLPLLDPFS